MSRKRKTSGGKGRADAAGHFQQQVADTVRMLRAWASGVMRRLSLGDETTPGADYLYTVDKALEHFADIHCFLRHHKPQHADAVERQNGDLQSYLISGGLSKPPHALAKLYLASCADQLAGELERIARLFALGRTETRKRPIVKRPGERRRSIALYYEQVGGTQEETAEAISKQLHKLDDPRPNVTQPDVSKAVKAENLWRKANGLSLIQSRHNKRDNHMVDPAALELGPRTDGLVPRPSDTHD